MFRYFESQPHLRPQSAQQELSLSHKIILSKVQSAQIKEIFDLFDTDGSGTLDERKLDFALVALGFQKEGAAMSWIKASPSIAAIIKDGSVTLEEFSALMTGELGGTNHLATLTSVFDVLSDSGLQKRHVPEAVITLDSLTRACKKYQVFRQP